MKYCPECRSSYTDKSLSYCLQDGVVLLDFKNANSQEKTVILQKETQLKLTEELKDQNAKSNLESIDKKGLKKNNFVGKFLSSLILLVIGGVLSVSGYYIWVKYNSAENESPKLIPMEFSNLQFAVFEKLRREVDSNPVAVIEVYEKTPPQDAADFYLLGRAQLLIKSYRDATISFIQARNKLKEYSETSNKAVITSDITIGLTIAEDKAAQSLFEKEMKVSKSSENTKYPIAERNINSNSTIVTSTKDQ